MAYAQGREVQLPLPRPAPVACLAERGVFDTLVGQPFEAVRDQFPVGEGLFGLREPGKIYTMQAVFGRTLVHIDEDGVVVRIRCG